MVGQGITKGYHDNEKVLFFPKGSLNIFVYRFVYRDLPFFDPPPLSGQFSYPESGQKQKLLTSSPPRLVHVVIEWPLILYLSIRENILLCVPTTRVSFSTVQPSINLEFLCTYKNLKMPLYFFFLNSNLQIFIYEKLCIKL